jgi:hypothetical protein
MIAPARLVPAGDWSYLEVRGDLWHRPLDQHDLDDLAGLLAQRTAMARSCPEADGRHACVLPPVHEKQDHQCRACPHTWSTP